MSRSPSNRPAAGGQRAQRLAGLATVVAACLIGFVTYLDATSGVQNGPGPIAVFVGLAAIVGSAINQPFRSDAASPRAAHPLLYVLWKGSVAVTFAFVLYLVFMGGIVSGELFPRFECGEKPFTDIRQFVLRVNPSSNADFAKLLLWSFVAGFSETFVPNLIARLEGQASGRAEETP